MPPSPLDFLGLEIPDSYRLCVRRARAAALITSFYVRPSAKVSNAEAASGSRLVRPPHLRPVPESDDMAAHIALSTRLHMIQPEFAASASADLAAAVERCASLCRSAACDLVTWRHSQRSLLHDLDSRLHDYGRFISSLMRGSAARIASHVNLALMACLVEALDYPDIACVERWFYGHLIVGDIPDTGLFRPLVTDYGVASPAAELSPASNRRWNSRLARSVQELAAHADPSSRVLLEGVEKQTRAELSNGFVRGPFSSSQLDARFGKGKWRAARRFGVLQGTKDDGSPKIRAIDNERGNLSNACSRTHETIAPITVAFVALVARLFYASFARAGVMMPRLAFGLDDIRAAYRVVPVRQPWYTVFAIWSSVRRRVEFYYLDGHNFGHRSGVLNFNAFAHLAVAVARVFFAVPCDHFYDDFLIVDVDAAGSSAQDALADSLRLLGQSHEPKKRKPMGPTNVGLGVFIDVSRAHHDLCIRAAATRDRVSALLDNLARARAEDYLSPAEASSIRGKLGFIFSSAYYRFGRAALQPFMQREYRDIDFSFSAALCEAHDFLAIVLPSLRPLEMRITRDDSEPLIVYSDAMFEWVMPGGGAPFRPLLRIGFVVLCPIARAQFYSSYELPLWYFSDVFSPDLRTYIAQGEAVGALAALSSLPAAYRDRPVIQFQDNTWALSALIHGYASRPDMGRVVNAFHVAQFALGARIWLEWVPSAANIADLPSRLRFDELLAILPNARRVPTVLPSREEWLLPFASFAGLMIASLSS